MKLVYDAVFFGPMYVLIVSPRVNTPSKFLRHEKGLNSAVHVASGPLVAQAQVFLVPLLILQHLYFLGAVVDFKLGAPRV